uniref:AP complex subunit beta n=1 Tax=Albugo laibachii Nc14 TaxID=890382 RepID=F0WGC1_9STRA|nr:AP1 complex subunit beta putative [Albugo laibachii Nc14]|eukprot:CCA20281.1 AP1 complex subunit beta putative [Albugo laibachii Nc14]
MYPPQAASMGGQGHPSYPPHGSHPPPHPNQSFPSSGAPPRGANNYFSDKKKGEVNELKNLLREVTVEKDIKRKREIIKKVIAYMTLGIDVSRLFSEMVLCVDTKDLITKKMVYLYLTNYANKNSELAIMCINTLLNDCRNEDPMVRGLALRSLCSLRLDSILEYIHDPLQHSLTDVSAYVRKTGVIGILKVHSMNPELIKDSDMIDTLYNMIRDRDPQVVSNCLVALNEIMADEGGMAINEQIVMHLLSRITDFNEWGQCNILHIVARYKPINDEQVFAIMNTLEQCLRVSNSAVVLGTTNCFFRLTERMDHLQDQVYERMRQPLLTLMAAGSHELNFCVLHHILLMVGRKAYVFSQDYRQFYNRYNEPTHVKYVKIEILSAIADAGNVQDIIMELSEYVTDVDQELARRSIRAIADIAVSNNFRSCPPPPGVPGTPEYDMYNMEAARHAVSNMQDQILDTMVEFLEMNLNYVRDESLVVMKDLLRKYPEKRFETLHVLPRIITSVEQAEAKAAIVWMIGEFGQDMRRAPYILEKRVDDFVEETSPLVQLELLTTAMKLFFKRPPEMQSVLGRLLSSAISDSTHQDVRDRALLYYRLLEHEQAASMVAQFKTNGPIDVFAEMIETDSKEKLFRDFNTLAVVYGKPSEVFISSSHLQTATLPEEESQESSEEEDEYPSQPQAQPQPQPQPQAQAQAPVQAHSSDLLDMEFVSAPSISLVANPLMDAGTFQARWTTYPIIGQVVMQLPSLIPQAEMERGFSAKCIYTMASGDVGHQYKFFFYAQDDRNRYFFAETVVDKAQKRLEATIKGETPSDGEAFVQLFKSQIC